MNQIPDIGTMVSKSDSSKGCLQTLVRSRPSPYYQDDRCTIYHGDCLEILDSIAPKIDIIITDPPYPDYYQKEYEYWDGCTDFLKKIPCRQIIFWTAKQEFPMCYDARHVWDKITGAANQYDFIYERNGNKRQMVFRGHRINSTVSAQFAGEYFYGHKSQKPIRLMRELVSKFSKPSDTIFDPFMGSGTTLLAAKELGRKAIGIERSERWCKISKMRIAQCELF
jgi:site-specific DNA-methyltransferase (adenine-specific)